MALPPSQLGELFWPKPVQKPRQEGLLQVQVLRAAGSRAESVGGSCSPSVFPGRAAQSRAARAARPGAVRHDSFSAMVFGVCHCSPPEELRCHARAGRAGGEGDATGLGTSAPPPNLASSALKLSPACPKDLPPALNDKGLSKLLVHWRTNILIL